MLWLEDKWAFAGERRREGAAAAIDDPTKRGGAAAHVGCGTSSRTAGAKPRPPGVELRPAHRAPGRRVRRVRAARGGLAVTQFPGRAALIVLVVGGDGAVPASPGRHAGGDGVRRAVVPARGRSTSCGGRRARPRAATCSRRCATASASRTVSTVDDLDLAQGPPRWCSRSPASRASRRSSGTTATAPTPYPSRIPRPLPWGHHDDGRGSMRRAADGRGRGAPLARGRRGLAVEPAAPGRCRRRAGGAGC